MKKLLLALALLWPGAALAATCASLPYTFTPNTTAVSSQVNSNFSTLWNCIINNTAAKGANSDITSLSALTTPITPIQGGTPLFIGSTVSGTNAIVIAATNPTNFTQIAGYIVDFVAAGTNTGAATANVDGTGVAAVEKNTASGLAALTGNEIRNGGSYALMWDGAEYVLQSGVNGPANLLGVGTAANNLVQLDGSGRLPAVDGSQLTAQAIVQGTFKNLKVSHTGNTASTITADAIVLSNGSGSYHISGPVNCSIDWSASGAAGKLDTGALSNTTWYYDWVIYNGTTTSCLGSASSSAPTMPGGYTYSARVGSDITDGSAHLLRVLQFNRSARYVVTSATNTAALTILASGTAGSISVPTWASISISGCVPPTASKVAVVLGTGTTGMLAPNNAYGAYNSTSNPPPMVVNNAGAVINELSDLTIESSNIYWASNGGSALVACYGWEDNL